MSRWLCQQTKQQSAKTPLQQCTSAKEESYLAKMHQCMCHTEHHEIVHYPYCMYYIGIMPALPMTWHNACNLQEM